MTNKYSLSIPIASLNIILKSLGTKQGTLFSRFHMPKINNADQKTVSSWWEKITDKEKAQISEIINQMNDPKKIADTFIIMEDSVPVCTQVVIPKQPEYFPFLAAKDSNGTVLNISYIEKQNQWINTLLSYLDTFSSLDQTKLRFKLPLDDFLVFLATVDTHRFNIAEALVKGEEVPKSIETNKIIQRLTYGIQNIDLRWLVSTFNLSLPAKLNPGRPEPVYKAIERLIASGLLIAAPNAVIFSESGGFAARSWNRRTAQIITCTAQTGPKNNLIFESNMYIRGDKSIWAIDVSSSPKGAAEVLVATIDEELAKQTLELIFKG